MPGAFLTRDLSAIFKVADFAVSALSPFDPYASDGLLPSLVLDFETGVYATDVGSLINQITPISGIFDNASEAVEIGERVAVRQDATFKCPTASGIEIHRVLVIDGQDYECMTPMHDGTGVTTWHLRKM